jgi:hypothetical protein
LWGAVLGAGVLGRLLTDEVLVAVVVAAASRLGVKAYEVDWAIWENQRGLIR